MKGRNGETSGCPWRTVNGSGSLDVWYVIPVMYVLCSILRQGVGQSEPFSRALSRVPTVYSGVSYITTITLAEY